MNLTLALMIITLVANSHTYSANFNCEDFTREAVNNLKTNDFDAFFIWGVMKADNWLKHFWVGIQENNTIWEFEPQTGELLFSYNTTNLIYLSRNRYGDNYRVPVAIRWLN